MKEKLKICSVTDRYIEFLRKDKNLVNVFDNKENRRSHTRKYLGVVLNKNNFDYFIPFSSPKGSDYLQNKEKDFTLDNIGERIIKKNTIPIIRVISNNSETNKPELKGTLKISNMIPVPTHELESYNIEKENDNNYKIIVKKEIEFIKDNYSLIYKNANLLYNQKTKENIMFKDGVKKPNYLNSVVDFAYAEEKCLEFCRIHNLSQYSKPKNKSFIKEKSITDNLHFIEIKVTDLKKLEGLSFEKRIDPQNPENAIIAIDKTDIDKFKNALKLNGNNSSITR